MHGFRRHRDLLGLPIDLDHPVIQPSIRVPHNVVQDDELFELLPEGLFQSRRPDEIAGAWRLRLRAVVAIIAIPVVVRATRTAVVGPSPLSFPVRICCPKTREILVWPWVFAQEDVCIFEALEEDLEAARFRG